MVVREQGTLAAQQKQPLGPQGQQGQDESHGCLTGSAVGRSWVVCSEDSALQQDCAPSAGQWRLAGVWQQHPVAQQHRAPARGKAEAKRVKASKATGLLAQTKAAALRWTIRQKPAR